MLTHQDIAQFQLLGLLLIAVAVVMVLIRLLRRAKRKIPPQAPVPIITDEQMARYFGDQKEEANALDESIAKAAGGDITLTHDLPVGAPSRYQGLPPVGTAIGNYIELRVPGAIKNSLMGRTYFEVLEQGDGTFVWNYPQSYTNVRRKMYVAGAVLKDWRAVGDAIDPTHQRSVWVLFGITEGKLGKKCPPRSDEDIYPPMYGGQPLSSRKLIFRLIAMDAMEKALETDGTFLYRKADDIARKTITGLYMDLGLAQYAMNIANDESRFYNIFQTFANPTGKYRVLEHIVWGKTKTRYKFLGYGGMPRIALLEARGNCALREQDMPLLYKHGLADKFGKGRVAVAKGGGEIEMFADELDTAEVIETELRIEFADEDDSDLETEEVLCPDCGYPVSSLDCNCSSKETD